MYLDETCVDHVIGGMGGGGWVGGERLPLLKCVILMLNIPG